MGDSGGYHLLPPTSYLTWLFNLYICKKESSSWNKNRSRTYSLFFYLYFPPPFQGGDRGVLFFLLSTSSFGYSCSFVSFADDFIFYFLLSSKYLNLSQNQKFIPNINIYNIIKFYYNYD